MIKTKNIELNVDFIGGQDSSLTKEEEQAIREFIRRQKAKKIERSSKNEIKV